MSKATLIEKRGSKLSATPALAAEVARAFSAGKTLPATIRDIDAKTGAKTIHLVSPIFWAKIAESLGPLDPSPASLRAARKSGERREVVALRASVPVSAVVKAEGKRPVYTGRGTKKHLAS
jgi:hypothetical protein